MIGAGRGNDGRCVRVWVTLDPLEDDIRTVHWTTDSPSFQPTLPHNTPYLSCPKTFPCTNASRCLAIRISCLSLPGLFLVVFLRDKGVVPCLNVFPDRVFRFVGTLLVLLLPSRPPTPIGLTTKATILVVATVTNLTRLRLTLTIVSPGSPTRLRGGKISTFKTSYTPPRQSGGRL